MRINKFLADAGICSRRGADELIAAGCVRVNGVTLNAPGAQVEPGRDRIEVRGREAALPAKNCCIMLNKPIQVVSTARDPQGRRTVIDCLPKSLLYDNGRKRRLYPVGRLDFFSEGLILLTDDGELTQRLIHPRHHIPKVYQVTIRGLPPASALETMRRGMTLAEGEKLAPVDVKILRREGDASKLEITLRQGLNRQIRRMCRDLGLTILRLARIAEGPLALGSLPPGAARLLTLQELAALRRAAGLTD